MKVTLITGASGGIGAAFARKLAAEKHHLLLIARSADKLSALCSELSSLYQIEARYIAINLADKHAALNVFQETEALGLEVNFLINNAGIGSAGEFTALDMEMEREMMTLNMLALADLTHHYLQGMRKRRAGTIINVASIAAFQPVPFMAVYAATKAFVRAFTEAITAENQPYDISILLLCPGATETNFFEAANIGAEGKKAIATAQVESPEQVVENALRAVRRGKKITISGFRNTLLTRIGHFIPNTLIASVIARQFRPDFEKKNQTG